MAERTSLAALLASRRGPLVADGATATNYYDVGLAVGDAPEEWNLTHPGRVQSLHRAFVDAGADVILTNTFGCARRRRDAADVARRAAELARDVADAVPRPIVVAGSVGPYTSLTDTFRATFEGLAAGGVDIVWIETVTSIDHALAAARAASDAGLPYTVTWSFAADGRTLAGETPSACVDAVLRLDVPPVALGVNCGDGPGAVVEVVRAIVAVARDVPVIAKANCGLPDSDGRYAVTPARLAAYARAAADAGARIIGGCCGATPAHVASMGAALAGYHT